ncbi:MAG TPA: hypothetical protein VGS11_10470 [Candidatus Bathyarchaeia archaeon]|nr:hypothetical protein [Candidatus Bathyarchaeia archaeon]
MAEDNSRFAREKLEEYAAIIDELMRTMAANEYATYADQFAEISRRVRRRPPPVQPIEERVKKLEESVHHQNDRFLEFEMKLEQLTTKLNSRSIEERLPRIVEYTSKLLRDIPFVDHAVARITDEGVNTLVIHDNPNKVVALTQIMVALNEVEDAFPDIYFTKLVLTKEEISPADELNTVTLYKRESR